MKVRIRITDDRASFTRLAPGTPSFLGTLMLRCPEDRACILQLAKSPAEQSRLRANLQEISAHLSDITEDGCPDCEMNDELHELTCSYGRIQELCWGLGPEHELTVEVEDD